MDIVLTNDQLNVYNKFLAFLTNDENLFVLTGFAGAGKTFLVKKFASALHNTSILCGISPTHKAKMVLYNTLNNKNMKEIAVLTVASLLGKLKDHSYIGTHKYSKPVEKKLASYELFILDEVSMVDDKDLKFIIHYVVSTRKKLVMIGDPYQIPCPSQPLVILDNMLVKEDSMAFKLKNRYELTEIVRQAKDSPIIAIATLIRDNIDTDVDVLGHFKMDSMDDFYASILISLKKYPLSTRCIVYTNDGVLEYNRLIRRQLGYKAPYVKGELMLSYNTIGFPMPYIVNGSDYVIISVQWTDKYMVNQFQCSGYLVQMNTPPCCSLCRWIKTPT